MEQVGIDLRVQGRAGAQQDLQAVQRDLDGLGTNLRDLDDDSARAAREFDTAMRDFREASRAMEGRVSRDLSDVGRDLRGLGDDAEAGVSDVREAFDNLAGGGFVTAGRAAGAGFVAAAVQAISEGFERERVADLALASLGAFTPEAQAGYQRAIDELYADAWGDDYADVSRTVAVAGQATFGLDLDTAGIRQAAEAALLLSGTTGADVSEILDGAANLAKTTGTDIMVVFDQIAAAVDGVNGVFKEDFFDVLKEYSARLDEMSLSSEQFLSVLGAASGTGAYNLDVVADSMAEMMNVIQEGGKPAQDALTRLGLDAKQILIDINAAGPQALQAFDEVLAALQRADDVVRSQATADLGGGPLENLGLGREGIDVLRAFNDGLVDVEGSLDQLAQVATDNESTRFTEALREFEQFTIPALTTGATHAIEVFNSLHAAVDDNQARTRNSLRGTNDELDRVWEATEDFGINWSQMFSNMAESTEGAAGRIVNAVHTILNPFGGGGLPRTGASIRDGLATPDLPTASDSWARAAGVTVNYSPQVSAVDAEGVATFFGQNRQVLAEEVARAIEQALVTGGVN